MRLDNDTSKPARSPSQSFTNGSSRSTGPRSPLGKAANGDSQARAESNGSYTNGGSTSNSKPVPATYFGHDRDEVTRILIQSLTDLGYHDAAGALCKESGRQLEGPTVASFRRSVLNGDWDLAEELLFGTAVHDNGGGVGLDDTYGTSRGKTRSRANSQRSGGLTLAEGANWGEMLFWMKQQKYLELLERRDLGSALTVLRQELTPLHQDVSRLHALSSLMMCPSAEDLRHQSQWDGAQGESRTHLLSDLSKSISPSVMIPEHRLSALLDEVKDSWINNCLYHNTADSPSLYLDHNCEREDFPTKAVLDLKDHTDEVWYLKYSNDGTKLASTSKDTTIFIYDTTTYNILHHLEDHQNSGVTHLAWSPDDSKIITCCSQPENSARIWDVKTAAWAPDGRHVVIGSQDDKLGCGVWDLSGRQVHNFCEDGTKLRANDLAISPNGERLVVASEHSIAVYDFASYKKLVEWHPESKLTSITISQDSRHMLVSMNPDMIELMEIDSADLIQKFEGHQQKQFIIRSAFGGADENFVVSGSEDSRIYIWRSNGLLVEALDAHLGCDDHKVLSSFLQGTSAFNRITMSHSVSFLGLLATVAPLVQAQYSNTSAPSFTLPSGYTTSTFNNSAQPTAYNRSDFSPNALASLWDLVGPVSTGPLTSTASPTPEPTAYSQPDGEYYHALVGSGYPEVKDLKLPAGFKWGFSSSAYQIEGAAKDEGKGPSIWDLLSHRVPNFVSDNTTGDVVASNYWLYKQDIARLKGLGVPAFSPSFSWPRFFPFGHGPVNEQAVKHYDDVISEMHANGIMPAVTLFHWDTPLALFNEYGAWTDRRIVDHFFNYAKFVISRYDEYVGEWFTINEPQYCNWQYSYYPAGEYYAAPNNITGGNEARFLCGHHTLLAHAKVAKWYHNEFKGRHRITFKNSGNYYEANSTSPGDIEARQRNFDFSIGWFGGPWTDGDYPASLKSTLGDLLPNFTQAEKDLIKGSCDFYAIDPYSSFLAFEVPGGLDACVSNRSHPSFPDCAGSASLAPNGFPVGPAADPSMSWLYSAPSGVRRFLKHITTELFPGIPDIVVSEFGFSEPFEARWESLAPALWDLRRADYLQQYLDNILLAIYVDGVNVTGAWGWAIFDNFEWTLGTSVRFGLQYVNYTSLERTPKASVFQFLNWFKEHEHTGNATMRMI
ncbi:hypothetical protein E8E11_006067 [Didymella keratinophila]|nr:hypothetical protein E8E11_006067 [Didymella keratinophila]